MKLLVVGVGSIGRRHLKNLLALGAGTVSICDTDPVALDAARREFGVEAFAGLDRALDRGPDAVLVCTPTHLHLPTARAALDAGAHLFIEKPLSASLEGTQELIALARAKRRVVLVGCNMRFHPGVAHLKVALAAGLPARPFYFRARFSHYLPNWRRATDYRRSYSARQEQGGGILLEGVHEVDYLRWFAGEVARVAAHAEHLSDLEIDSEDYALLLLQFQNGAIGQIHLDCLSSLKLRGCEIVGTAGIVRWWSEGKEPEIVRVQAYDGASGRNEDLYTCVAYDANLMYVDEMRHFLDCVSGASTPLLDLEGAARVLTLMLAGRGAADACDAGWRDVPSCARMIAL